METETQQTLFLEDSSDEKHSMLDSALEPPTRATRDRAVRVAVERRDWDVLAELSSQPGGFQEARSVAWPFLLHVRNPPAKGDELLNKEESITQDNQSPPSPKSHRDERQVGLDTNRAFVHYPVESQQRKDKRKKQLTELILGVLERRPQLSYFQGYHDILSTLQLTLHPSTEKDEAAFRLLQECAIKISLHRARDSMGVGLEPLTGQLRILRRLLRLVDPQFAILIEETSPLPYWAISPLMTLYTHDLPTLALAQRVMDWILSRPPDAVIYLVAAFTLEKRKGVQQLIDEGDDGMMHSFLSGLPELEADELEPPAEKHDTFTLQLDPVSALAGTAPDTLDSDSAREHPSKLPALSVAEPPYSKRNSPESVEPFTAQSQDTSYTEKPIPSHTSLPTPPSPASSLSSLPPQDPSMDQQHGPTVPLSHILQAADRLRSNYPITHEKLRLDETLGPKSMLRTWSSNPNEILGDDAAEEAVLATDLVVLPDLDDDVFEPYPPPTSEPTKARFALMPKLDMGIVMSLGIPMVAAVLAVASSSPTARANARALAFNFVEFILQRLRFDPLPAINLYD